MSEPEIILSTLKQKINAKKGILKVHNFLLSFGAKVDEHCTILLNDTEEIEIDETEDIIEINAALKRIYDWPTLGGISYKLKGSEMNVFFWSRFPGELEMIQFSIIDSVYAKEGNKNFYNDLAKKLHYTMTSKRTILGWNLKDFGFYWDEELERLDKDSFLEHKTIELDLRSNN